MPAVLELAEPLGQQRVRDLRDRVPEHGVAAGSVEEHPDDLGHPPLRRRAGRPRWKLSQTAVPSSIACHPIRSSQLSLGNIGILSIRPGSGYADQRMPNDAGEGRVLQMAEATKEIGGLQLPPAGKYELDLAHTAVEFVARHILTKVRGRFTDFSGLDRGRGEPGRRPPPTSRSRPRASRPTRSSATSI